jgi:hypothetical protein
MEGEIPRTQCFPVDPLPLTFHTEILARVLSWISMTTIKLEEHEKAF